HLRIGIAGETCQTVGPPPVRCDWARHVELDLLEVERAVFDADFATALIQRARLWFHLQALRSPACTGYTPLARQQCELNVPPFKLRDLLSRQDFLRGRWCKGSR